jgi:hypothetical protein
MKRLSYLAIIVAALLLAGCSAGGRQLAQPNLSSGGSATFVLSDEGSIYQGASSPFAVDQSFDALSGRLSVTVSAHDARGLKAATLILSYPADSYHLVKADYAGGLGDEVVTAIIPRCPEVNMGAAITNLDEREGVNGDCILFTAEFALGAETTSRAVAAAPSGVTNQVALTGTINTQNIVNLRWLELNRGDGNNDGKVNIADITPIAQSWGRSTTDGQNDKADFLADYNANGTVGISDLTILAMAFGRELAGYDVESGLALAGPFTKMGTGTPTVKRSDINPTPGRDNGQLQYIYNTTPIDGIVYFRVVAKDPQGNAGAISANVLMMQSMANITSMTIDPPASVDPWLVITEEAIDAIVGNEQPFAKNTMQLTAMGVVEGEIDPIDVTNQVEWSIETGGSFATIGNTIDTDKGLLTVTDVGNVVVLAHKADDFAISGSITVPVYAISDITLRVVGQPIPADVDVPLGNPVTFEAIGIFDDNDADDTDTLEIPITPYVSWAIGRPIIDPGPPVVYEGGTFTIDTFTGMLQTDDPGLAAGYKGFITAIFPPEAVTPVIGGGFRANSNMLTVTMI